MNKVILLILSLLVSVAFGQRATVTILQPRMYDASTNAASLCNVKNSAADPPVLDNCPGGSTCVEGSVAGKGRCTVFTLAEHQGATAYDYTASRVLRAETQLDENDASALACDLSDVSALTDNDAKWRCLEHAVHLYLGDNEAIADYDASCTVTYGGNIGGQLDSGTLAADGMDSASLTSGFASDASDKKLSCHYVPQNNKYLGYAFATVKFTKKAASLGLGEKADKLIKVPLRYVPGNTADAGHVDSSDTSYVNDPDLSNAHTLISMPTASDGITGSTSDAGTMKLTYVLNVQDSRYLINSQSGVEVLTQAAGNFNLIKEGLEIHSDYSNFYDSAQNAFVNSDVQASPIAYSDYKSGACDKKGLAAGLSLAACAAGGGDAAYYDNNYAQYALSGTYEATYGGMAHFKKGYIGCQICDNRLAIQGFATQAGTPQIDVALDVDVSSLNSGCDGGTTTCITLSNIFADPVGEGVENGKALRLPNCDNTVDGDGNPENCGTAGGYDPQHADGHVLGEFFTPKIEGTTAYGDYDSDFDFLSNNRLIVTSETKLVADTADSGLHISSGCATNGQGKVYTMSNDMLAAANDLFYNKCRIVVSNVEFAKKSTIVYFKDATDKTACADAACTNAVYAQITQVDNRRVLVGAAELSLLRRKLATVDKAGAAITMSISKYTETASQVLTFDIVGTNTMMGYDSSGTACDQAAVDDVANLDCTEVAVSGEILFASSDVNGEIKEHTIRSSPACTGFLDVQFRDQGSFAIYDLRIPCSRTTAKASDSISLTFDFTLGYDLVDNLVTAKAYYLSDMASASEDAVGNPGSGLEQDLDVAVSYGYCSGTNEIEKKNDAAALLADGGCDEAADATGLWTDSAGNSHFTSSALDLNEWSHCAQQIQDDNANNNYIVTTRIAMQYTRVLKYTSGSGATQSTNKFCADRRFVTTIRRDSTATVTVATLQAPTLERAVSVTDIEWVSTGCAAGYYKLQIGIASVQKDTSHDGTSAGEEWQDSNLKQILKPTSSSAQDSDSLQIDLSTGNTNPLSEQHPSHKFVLHSQCILITAADCDERCDADGQNCAAQTNSDSGCAADPVDAECAQSDYSKLTHTITDLVLRGDFTGSAVDSDVTITTRYVECPLDESNVATSAVVAAATMQCDAEISNVASPTVDSATNCAQAFTTDSGTAEVKLYVTDNDFAATPDYKVTAAENTAADTANWQIRQSSIYIERYEKNFDGSEGSLLSSEKFCECGDITTEYAAPGTACTETNTRVFGLIQFTTLDCGRLDGSDNKYDQIKFNFLPLADATNDAFKVKFVLLAENTDLDAVNTRRRLRRVETTQDIVLKAPSPLDASASSFSVVVPSYNTADDVQPAPDLDTSTTAAPTAAPEDDDEMEWYVIALIIIGSIVGLYLLIVLANCGVKCCKADEEGGLASLIPKFLRPAVYERVSSGEGAAVGIRQQRFSNLRY